MILALVLVGFAVFVCLSWYFSELMGEIGTVVGLILALTKFF